MNALCQCGCGEPAPIATETRADRGWVKGEPLRFIRGHNASAPIAWAVDEESGCWIWSGRLDTGRYPYGRHGKRWAHRVVYELKRGPIPAGMKLDHTCRNPPCVNPDHLEPVTNAENIRRGRSAKLTRSDASEIRRRRAHGEREVDVARRFGVHRRTIRSIVHGENWSAR